VIIIIYRFPHLLTLRLQLLLIFYGLFNLIQFFVHPLVQRLQSGIIFIIYKLILAVAHQLRCTLIKLQCFALELRSWSVVNAGVTVTWKHSESWSVVARFHNTWMLYLNIVSGWHLPINLLTIKRGGWWLFAVYLGFVVCFALIDSHEVWASVGIYSVRGFLVVRA